jgi:hypothetical protein
MSKFQVLVMRLAIGAVGVAALFVNARSYDSAQPQNRPLELLQQSHNLSEDLAPLDRTYALLFLLMNGEGIIPESQYREWCSELGKQSRRILDGWDRVAHEKNALLCLSKVDAIEALHQYSTIEDPQPQVDGTYPEDVRANGATIIFPNAWKSQATIEEKFAVLRDIEAEASRIGRTGEYPYEAMGKILVAVVDTGTDEADGEAEKIFREALHFYREEPHKFITRDREFRKFLEATKDTNKKIGKKSNDALLADAVQVFVDKVLHSPKDMDYVSEIRTPKGVTRFTDDRAELLFQEFPTVQELNVDLAAQLKRQNPELNKAVLPMDPPITGGYVALDKDTRAIQKAHDKISQTSVVKQIPPPGTSNLTGAQLNEKLDSIAKLSDDAIRIQGYCALVPHLVKLESRSAEAKQVYERELSRLQGLQNEDDHLKATVALAKASRELGDQAGFSDLTNTALREGALLFERDTRLRPEWPPTGRRGFNDLRELVTFAAPHLQTLHPQLEHIENLGLRVNLLSFEAKALNIQAGK